MLHIPRGQSISIILLVSKMQFPHVTQMNLDQRKNDKWRSRGRGERGRSSLFYSRSIHLPSPLRYIKLVYYLFTRYIWTPSVTSEGVVGNSEVWCQMKHTHHVVYPQYHQLLFKFTSRNNMFFWREWHPNTLTRSSAQLTSTWHLMPLKLGTITG